MVEFRRLTSGEDMRIIVILIFTVLAGCQTPAKHITTNDWNLATKQVIRQYKPHAENHVQPLFEKKDIPYPPKKIAFLAFKKELKLELWANHKNQWHYITTYPIKASSGHPGPKLKENDDQIPEGIYKILFLQPFSKLHLSMKLNYPNLFDRQHALQDGRTHLGGDIFIHGKALSAGCIAIGDHYIEDLFELVNDVGTDNVLVIIAPNDLRFYAPITEMSQEPDWTPELYAQLKQQLSQFRQG